MNVHCRNYLSLQELEAKRDEAAAELEGYTQELGYVE